MQLDVTHILAGLQNASTEKFDTGVQVRIKRLIEWVRSTQPNSLDRYSLIEFARAIGTTRILIELKRAFARSAHIDPQFMIELTIAARDYQRKLDGRKMSVETTSAAWWKPFLLNCDVDILSLSDIGRLDNWLCWANQHNVISPSIEDYLNFVEHWKTERALVDLLVIFNKLGVPKSQATELNLAKAISRKRSVYRGRDHPKPKRQPKLKYSARFDELPRQWQDIVKQLRQGRSLNGKRAPAKLFIPKIEISLRTFCFSCQKSGRSVELTEETIRNYLSDLEARDWRGSSQQIEIQTLKHFMQYLGAEPIDIKFAG